MGLKAYVTVVENKSDGIFGTTLLFVGFVYQTLGYTRVECAVAVIASYAGLVLFLFAYCTFLRKKIVRKWVGNIEAKFRERQP
ncbi:MAG: hypothetical protein IPK65_01210 [Gammaproteobacteria bacterium]|nr:hypothetical protein [Gammaproteobacteria bacterium]